MTSELTPTVAAPSFGDDPLGYYVWHLQTHGAMYQEFRRHADLYRASNPARRISADMICHVMRYQSGVGAADDQFSINNVLTPLYARLYRLERPDANFDLRKSWLDMLLPHERLRIYLALGPLREVAGRDL